MRRKDRERGKDFALSVFDRAPYCVIGMAAEDGSAYTVPLSAVRDGSSLYFHSADEGRKLELLRRYRSVSVTAVSECMIDSDGYTVRYSSAHADAMPSEVLDRDEKIKALMLIAERFAPDNVRIDRNKYIESFLSRTSVWRLDILNAVGKENRK